MNTRADLEAFVRDEKRVRLYLDDLRYLTRDAFPGESEWDLFAKMRALLADREAKLTAVRELIAKWHGDARKADRQTLARQLDAALQAVPRG